MFFCRPMHGALTENSISVWKLTIIISQDKQWLCQYSFLYCNLNCCTVRLKLHAAYKFLWISCYYGNCSIHTVRAHWDKAVFWPIRIENSHWRCGMNYFVAQTKNLKMVNIRHVALLGFYMYNEITDNVFIRTKPMKMYRTRPTFDQAISHCGVCTRKFLSAGYNKTHDYRRKTFILVLLCSLSIPRTINENECLP